MKLSVQIVAVILLGNFRLEYKDEGEYNILLLNMRSSEKRICAPRFAMQI